METVRWKPLLIAKDAGQLQRLTLQLDANDIRHAMGSHRRWKAISMEPWLMVPAEDFSRAIALSGSPAPGRCSEHGDKSGGGRSANPEQYLGRLP